MSSANTPSFLSRVNHLGSWGDSGDMIKRNEGTESFEGLGPCILGWPLWSGLKEQGRDNVLRAGPGPFVGTS